MSTPKKRDSTLLLLEKYGDKLRQIARQQSVAEDAKTTPAKSNDQPETVVAPAAAEPAKPVDPAPTKIEDKPSHEEVKLVESAPAVAEEPQAKTQDPSTETAAAPAPVEPAVEEKATVEPSEDNTAPEVHEEAPVVVVSEESPAEPDPAPATEETPESTESKNETIEEADHKEPEQPEPASAEPIGVEHSHGTEPSHVAEPVVEEKKADMQEVENHHHTESQEIHAQEAATNPTEPEEISHKPEPLEEAGSVQEEPESAMPEIEVIAAEAPPSGKKKRRRSRDKERAVETSETQDTAEDTQTSTPLEAESPIAEPVKELPKSSPVTSEIVRVRWAILVDRVEWTFGYSKLANHRMKVDWDLEDGLDNIQGTTEVAALKEGEDYIDLNVKLRFSASVLARDLDTARFKPKIMTFTLFSETEKSILGIYELDLRTVMAPGKPDTELRFKLFDEDTRKSRTTSPSLVMIVKRVKWESVNGEKTSSSSKRGDIDAAKPQKEEVVTESEKTVEPEKDDQEEETVLEEPKEKRRERLRREQSTRRKARKDAIDAEDTDPSSSPSSSAPNSPYALSPGGKAKSSRRIKILRTNSRYETVEDVDK